MYENNNQPSVVLARTIPPRKGTQVITKEWLVDCESFIDPSGLFWLDEQHFIYSIPPKTIEKLNIKTKERTELGEGAQPKPSPDGQWIAFIRGDEKEKQLWVMRSDGQEPRALSTIPEGLTGYYEYSYGYSWSPDSSSIALYYQSPHEKEKTVSKIDECESSTKNDNETSSFQPQALSIIDVIYINTRELKRVLTLDARLECLSWFLDGKKLLFMSMRAPDVYVNQGKNQTWINEVEITGEHLTTLAAFGGMQQFLSPTVSPDGNKVAFLCDVENPLFNYMNSLCVIDISIKNTELPKIVQLTKEFKLSTAQWSQDGSKIYVGRYLGAYQQIFSVDVETHTATQLTKHAMSISGQFISSMDGSTLAWYGKTPHGTSVFSTLSTKTNQTNEIISLPSVGTEEIALSEIREIDWKVSNYPVEMRGLLILPLNYQEGTRYPLIVDIHGGGAGSHIFMCGGILSKTSLEWQLWAAKGYIVFVPEMRSSGVFGSLAITRDQFKEHNLIACDVKDIQAGADYLIEKGFVDVTRMIAIGQSAGARRINWLIVTKNKFCATISKEGWACDLIQSDIMGLKNVYQTFGGTPFDVPQNYLKNSSIFHAKNVQTPTLFLMGNPQNECNGGYDKGADKGNTVRFLWNALKDKKIETQYIYYPEEGHYFECRLNQLDALTRCIQWIEKHFTLKLQKDVIEENSVIELLNKKGLFAISGSIKDEISWQNTATVKQIFSTIFSVEKQNITLEFSEKNVAIKITGLENGRSTKEKIEEYDTDLIYKIRSDEESIQLVFDEKDKPTDIQRFLQQAMINTMNVFN